MSDNIPFELQVEIMKNLPVKSLAVSRSVSKLWKSTIDSPRFITNHTNMRRHHRLLLIMFQRYEVGTFRKNYDFKYVSIMENDDTLSRHTLDNVPVSLKQLKELQTVGTSQGLLCLSGYYREDGCYYKETAVIWNPSLGKSIVVDVPYQRDGIVHKVQSIGFGVRPDNCDPMIVRVCVLERPMVFTLSSRVWRVPRGNLLPESIYFPNMCPVATNDRCIYWQAYEKERNRNLNLVVAFDMVSEDFTEIKLPHSVAHRFFNHFSISKIKESLALLEYYDDDDDKPVCNVWMMVEDGVSKSFTKLFTINTLGGSSYTFVLGFTKNDQPIMETNKHWPLSSVEVYEPHTGFIKNLGIYGLRDVFFCCSYTESLLLLDQLDGQFIEIQLQL